MRKRFEVEVIVENGQAHYKITDLLKNNVIHCDFNELNEIIYELLDK